MGKTKKKVTYSFGLTEVSYKKMYNTIDYKDAFNHIRELADLEWNGIITLSHFRERVNDIISVISEKESK
jgi:hypothetical protein